MVTKPGSGPCLALETSLVEWKLDGDKAGVWSLSCLGNFLSGMETTPPKRRPEDIEHLGNFLSGMETAGGVGPGVQLQGLGNFLSGMETDKEKEEERAALGGLGNFLSGMETLLESLPDGLLRLPLETSLVEWKLPLLTAIVPDSNPLETSLVEWKPIPGGETIGAARSLETSLVEWKPLDGAKAEKRAELLGNFLSGMETEVREGGGRL